MILGAIVFLNEFIENIYGGKMHFLLGLIHMIFLQSIKRLLEPKLMKR